VAVSFDRVAPFYRGLEILVFGGRLQAARCTFVREVTGARRALVVGEGDGRFLEQLLRAQPELQVECLDASATMLALARRRVGDDRVQFIRADLREAAFPPQRYDLLVTHFFLDCFEEAELARVVEKLSAAATDAAIWLIADFQEPRRGWRRAWARLLIATMYLFFRIAAGPEARRLVDYTPLLQRAGFALTSETISPNEVVRSQWWERKARPA
jgi:ubiquinone/menaquinone biosynthesis C-methylase UbiE